VRQVGQLPRIIARCTVNKTLNFTVILLDPRRRKRFIVPKRL